MKSNSNIHGLLVPHSPTLLEDELMNTPSPIIEALQQKGRRLKDWDIGAVIAVSTHWQTHENFHVDASPFHSTITDYYGFRKEIEYDVAGLPDLARILISGGQKSLLPVSERRRGVDHAVTIPLYFMFPEKNIPVIPLSVSGSPLCAFRWGRQLGKELRSWNRNVLFMASGSLSHDLSAFMRGSTAADYETFDRRLLQLLSEGNGMDVLNLDPKLIDRSKPEGGFRDLMMLLGVMGSQTRGNVLAYQALPGVGLGVVEFQDAESYPLDEVLLENEAFSAATH